MSGTGSPDRPRIFLDADVLIAGSISTQGASHLILQLGELGLIELVSCEQVRTECERNLRRKIPSALPAFGVLANEALRWVPDVPLRDDLGRTHPKDAPILSAAIATGCSSLLTFNTDDYDARAAAIVVERPGDFLVRLRAILAGSLGAPG